MENEWLVEFRNKKNMTQEEVSDLCDIKRPYYSMIENGKRRPSVDVAKRIATVLEFDWILFFARTGNDSLLSSQKAI